MLQTHPHLRPCMRFLFVRPEFCPSGDLSTPEIRLSSDSASRRTPLPLTKSSRYRATSGLSPYRTCAHHVRSPRALTGRTAKGGDSSESPPGVFWFQKTLLAKASQATMHTGSGCRRPEETSCRIAVQHPNHASQSPQLFAAREPAPAGNGSRWQNCPCPATRSAHPPV